MISVLNSFNKSSTNGNVKQFEKAQENRNQYLISKSVCKKNVRLPKKPKKREKHNKCTFNEMK